MIGIANIASYIPPNFESNFDRRAEFGIDEDFIINKIGVEQVSRRFADEETSDLCLKAFSCLNEQCADLLKIDCLIVCTQNPDGKGIPHTSAIVHGKMGLPDQCACFDISLGCSGYVYALSIVKSFMEANGLATGLLFTADPYSKVIDPNDKSTVLLFGDAATVTLLADDSEKARLWVPTQFSFATRGREADALHSRGKYLFMNGRPIFNMSVKEVPLQIRDVLSKASLSHSDVDLFLLHQGSKYMLDQLCKRMGLLKTKVPINLAKQGNTVSSSLPLLLEEYIGNPSLKNIIMAGFGVGLSWASCLLQAHQSS